MAAPVCHVNPSQDIKQPALKLLASIGTPRDLPSALRAISQLTQVINLMVGAQPVRSGDAPADNSISTAGGFNTRPSKKPPAEKDGRWAEVRSARVIERVRIEQEDNPENWVEFDRINRLEFIDSVTGETWQWRRK